MNCGSCGGNTSRKSHITCSGFCKKRFHTECVKVPTEVINFLSTVKGLHWSCNTCDSGVEDKLKEIVSTQLRKECSALLQNVSEELQTIGNNVIQSVSEKCEAKFSSSGTPMASIPYSAALKRPPKLIVRPKNPEHPPASTKAAILDNLNLMENHIELNSVKHISNGGILLSCGSDSDASKFYQMAKDKLTENFEVIELRGADPQVRIVGLSKNTDSINLENLLRKQNSSVFHSSSLLKVVRVFQTKKNADIYQATLQVCPDTFKRCIDKGRLVVGLDSCVVFEAIHIPRCYTCNSLHHVSKYCKNRKVCPLCAGSHDVKSCPASTGNNFVPKCSNCDFHNSKRPNKIPVDHAAWDYKNCGVYKRSLEQARAQILGCQKGE